MRSGAERGGKVLHDRLFRRIGLIALATVAALVAAACGGGGEEGGGGEGDVTIGILVPLTGELGSFGGPWQQTVKFAADEINEVGGLPGGAEISTVVDDEKADPEAAVQAARRMVEVEDVSAIIGPSSAAMVALVPFAKRTQVPVIGVASGTVTLNELGGDFVYRTVASDASDGLAIAKFLADQQAQDVGLLVQNEESTLSPAQIFQSAYEESGGTLAEKVVYNPGQPSYRAELEKVLSADPAWIVCACGRSRALA
jgi:branched-chain amino acid transport system substrate-binding protein